MKDITGTKHFRLTAEKPLKKNASGGYVWLWRCDCGGTSKAAHSTVKSGNTKSCGCLQREIYASGGAAKRHGRSNVGDSTYEAWRGMKKRCTNPNERSYKDYGARGIKFCKRWAIFENFLADMGICPPGHSIERIDKDGNYKPSNCKWIPNNLQQQNTRRNRMVTFRGETACLSELIRKYSVVPAQTVWSRVCTRKWNPEKALTTPLKS
jgi:hypothetical protein